MYGLRLFGTIEYLCINRNTIKERTLLGCNYEWSKDKPFLLMHSRQPFWLFSEWLFLTHAWKSKWGTTLSDMDADNWLVLVFFKIKLWNFHTMFENKNERKKTKPVPIPLPRASRNFPDVKTRNEKKFHNWTSEIIPFIRFGKQMDGA